MTQYSYASFVSSGLSNNIPLPFPFLNQSDVHCYVTGVPAAVTISIANPSVITWPGHGLNVNAPFQIQANGGTLPTGVAQATTYYVLGAGLTANTFQYSLTQGGAPIVATGSQSGSPTATSPASAPVEQFGFTFNGVSSITLGVTAASLNNCTVTVRRITGAAVPAVTFATGAPSPADMNTQTLQLFYMAQEALDNLAPRGDGNFYANGQRIEHLQDPINASDAATRNYVDSNIVANLLSVNQVAAAVAAAAAASASAATAAAATQTTATFNSLLGSAVFTGGSINNVPIGATTPSTGKFSTLWSTGTLRIDGLATFNADLIMTGTGEIQVPAGSIAQRSGSPALGMMRYNNDPTISTIEAFTSAGWVPLAAPAAQVNLGSAFPGGRLTLTSGVSVLLATVAAAAVVYYTPHIWNNIPLWNGASFQSTVFSEMGNTLANSSLGSAGPLAASPNAVYDLFMWSLGGVPTLTRGDMWAKASPASSTAVTLSIGSPCTVTWNSHGFVAGQPIQFQTSGALPTGVNAGQTYYVIAAGLTTSTFEFSATIGGSAVITSGSQSGTQTGFASVSVTVAAPGVVSWIAHGLLAGCPIRFSSTGTLPTGIAANTTYYVIAAGLTANAFEFSTTVGGSAVTTSGSPSGVLSIIAGTGGQSVSNGLAGTETRGLSPLSNVQGVLVNTNAITNGPAAGAGTYVGTIMTDATGATVTWNPGGTGAGGVAAQISLWNAYNRRQAPIAVVDTTASHAFSSGFRSVNGSAGNSIVYVCGQAGDPVNATYAAEVQESSTGNIGLSFGLDSSTINGPGTCIALVTALSGAITTLVATYTAGAKLGAHTLFAIELASGAGTQTVYGGTDAILSGTVWW